MIYKKTWPASEQNKEFLARHLATGWAMGPRGWVFPIDRLFGGRTLKNFYDFLAMEGSDDKKIWKNKKFLIGVGVFVGIVLIFVFGGYFYSEGRFFSAFSASLTQTFGDVFGSDREILLYEVDLEDEIGLNSPLPSGENRLVFEIEVQDADQVGVVSKEEGKPNSKNPILANLSSLFSNPAAMKVLISEVGVGSSVSANDEFVEIYNYGTETTDLTGWSIKKKSASGSEQTLVSSERFKGKIILPGKYFLIASEKYQGKVLPDVVWAKSYALAYENNSLMIYNTKGELVDKVFWTEIPKDKSYARLSLDMSAGFEVVEVPSPTSVR